MKISIIKEDGTVVKDGVVYIGLDLSALPDNFHALQWDTSSGDLETKDANNIPSNTAISDLSPYQFCVDAWQAAYDAEHAIAAEQAAIAAAEIDWPLLKKKHQLNRWKCTTS
jgi:hypothetical protein